jgi:biopolymer transport protein ExbD
MKNFNLIVCFLAIFASACVSKKDYKLQGETPSGPFNIMEVRDGDIKYVDAESIALRNRVYIILDTQNHVSLNGHFLSMQEFKEGLSYIYHNPDRLAHLPIHPDSAVFFLNYGYELGNMSSFSENKDETEVFKIGYINYCLKGLFYQKINHFIEDKGKDWQTVDASELQSLSNDFAWLPRIAIAYSDQEDKGISVKLPPWSEEEPDISKLAERNVLRIRVDAQNKVFVNDKEVKVEALTDMTKAFIANPESDPNLAESPRKAIISLKNERGTNYKAYLEVYNALKTAYDELWDELSQRKYGIPYSDDMPLAKKKAIRDEIPFVISEAEPTSFGEE